MDDETWPKVDEEEWNAVLLLVVGACDRLRPVVEQFNPGFVGVVDQSRKILQELQDEEWEMNRDNPSAFELFMSIMRMERLDTITSSMRYVIRGYIRDGKITEEQANEIWFGPFIGRAKP